MEIDFISEHRGGVMAVAHTAKEILKITRMHFRDMEVHLGEGKYETWQMLTDESIQIIMDIFAIAKPEDS